MRQRRPSRQTTNNLTLMLGGIAALFVFIVLGLLFGSGRSTPTPTATPVETPTNAPEGIIEITLGGVAVTQNINANNCAVSAAENFAQTDTVYAVLQDSTLPAGTTVFARLQRENELIEDAPETVISNDASSTCVSFSFQPTAEGWAEGDYEVQFIVNRSPYESVSFTVP
jgi:hypothetical protein